MRYLFTLLCVCALGLVPLVGCSETADCGQVPSSHSSGTCEGASCCEGLYCRTQVDACGEGQCSSLPRICNPDCEETRPVSFVDCGPVCGCDGEVYDDPCDAYRAGVDIGTICSVELTPVGYVPCGPRYCNLEGAYCQVLYTDTPSVSKNSWGCKPLPTACAGVEGEQALCECLDLSSTVFYDCRLITGNGVQGIRAEGDLW